MSGDNPVRQWNLQFTTDRRNFEAALDRVEQAQQAPAGYGLVEHLADVETARRFVDRWWSVLTNREQTAYTVRIAAMRRSGKGIR